MNKLFAVTGPQQKSHLRKSWDRIQEQARNIESLECKWGGVKHLMSKKVNMINY